MTPYYCQTCKAMQPQRRRFAYTAVITEKGWIVGRAEEGTRGYTPMPDVGTFTDEREARISAGKMNQDIGWTNEGDAQMMVLTTMPMKEDHQASLLFRAAELFRKSQHFGLQDWAVEINEWLKDVKGYAKESE